MHRHTMVIPSLYQCLKDSVIFTSLNTRFENGCRDTLSDSFLPGPYATLHIISQALVLCPGESKLLLENTNPNFDYFGHHNLALILRINKTHSHRGRRQDLFGDGYRWLMSGKWQYISRCIGNHKFVYRRWKLYLRWQGAIDGRGWGRTSQRVHLVRCSGFGNEIANEAQLSTTFNGDEKNIM